MGLTISYSKLAQHDLREIYNYIRRGSVKYAHLEVKLIRDAIAKLKINPSLGKKFEETDDKSSRELPDHIRYYFRKRDQYTHHSSS